MTVQEIEGCLKKHGFLIFKYQSEYYSLMKTRTLFGARYSLMTSDTVYQRRNSLKELCEQTYLRNGVLLAEAIRSMEIPAWNDRSWETYEAVRHSAIVYGREIHFAYGPRKYWIAHTPEGVSHLSDDLGDTQNFRSCRDLFEYARINGKTLREIWDEVAVDAC